jgi:lysophospholipase L1-like esterase
VTLKDSLDNTIWTQDNCSTPAQSSDLTAILASIAANTASIVTNTANITTLRSVDNDLIEQTAVNLAAGTAVTVACFGDSTMWGADPASLGVQVATPSPAQLQNLINNYFGNSALTVTNNAISGTTATQMIAGTDGSGTTFASKMAASSAAIVYCNHGVNDAFGPNATTATAYKTALLAFINTVRGVSKTPVLVTPFPALTIGTFGSQARAEVTAYFAQVMRDVAYAHGVTLVDNNRYLKLFMGMDGTLPLSVLADGVHGPQATYSRAGNNLAEAILGGQTSTFEVPNQRIPVSSAFSRATTQAFSPSTTSRVGLNMTSATTVAQTLRLVFKVDQPGMDLYLGHPIWSGGSDNISISIDGLTTLAFNQKIAGFVATFYQDFETLLARSIAPGFHVILMTTASAGAAGANYLRTRLAEKPVLLLSTAAVAAPGHRKLLSKKMELTSAAANTTYVCDEMPMSRLVDGYEFEWTGNMANNTGMIVSGIYGSTVGVADVEKAIIFGLGNAGLFSVSEASAPATYATTAVGAVNLAGVSHLYRVAVTSAGVATLYVDDVSVGTYNMTQPYFGGLLGLWKNTAGGTLTVTDVCRVWRT